ncbi:hypothetical protein BD780_000214 [Clostridium tetanomorphum]|uniref:DUF2634 domain-containing protein n=1 Tax=Clostridium tetanomorphum TaxID=1553 RepID=UPI0004490732|nr:DUF2634 domain-containing protein [Clostridium tetanomorphum]KAJ51092.1 hypothetical protein CTM_14438 [Clostridium tetanomorphum DSM 665]MBP1864480.1 hypothetical protein [Clostridium tetanomorphum]NRS82989.1 hypothetical protein [Clostridium tetanomorphum]SQC01027.1 phage protein [Clostridium tetanomorphum]
MSILPEINLDIDNIIKSSEENILPLFKEYAWDFEENKFIYENGKMKVLEGKEALKVWIYKALNTPRFRYLAYSWDYGHEFENLIGQTFSKKVLQSEGKRYLEECLIVNPYIIAVNNILVEVDGVKVTINCVVDTIYGEVNINV